MKTQASSMLHPHIKIEKVDVKTLFRVKHRSGCHYVTLPRELVNQYGIHVGHVLKIHIKEVRKPKFEEE